MGSPSKQLEAMYPTGWCIVCGAEIKLFRSNVLYCPPKDGQTASECWTKLISVERTMGFGYTASARAVQCSICDTVLDRHGAPRVRPTIMLEPTWALDLPSIPISVSVVCRACREDVYRRAAVTAPADRLKLSA